MKKLNIKSIPKKVIVSAMVALAVILVAFGYIGYYKFYEPNIVGSVGSTKITKDDVREEAQIRFGKTKDGKDVKIDRLTKGDIVDYLIEVEVAKQNSTKLGVSVSDKDITDAISGNLGLDEFNKKSEEGKKLVKKAYENSLYLEKVKLASSGWREGELILFRFDKYLDIWGDEIEFTNKGNEAKANEQKAYAQTLSASVYEKLNSKSIDFNAAKQLVLTDPQVGTGAYSVLRMNITSIFDRDKFTGREGYFDQEVYQGFEEAILTAKAGEITEPKIVKVSFDNKSIDFAYMIANVTAGEGDGVKPYVLWLEEQKTSLNSYNFYNRKNFLLEKLKIAKEFVVQTAYACTTSLTNHSNSSHTNLRMVTVYKNDLGVDTILNNHTIVVSGPSYTTDAFDLFDSACSFQAIRNQATKITQGGGFFLNSNDNNYGQAAVFNCHEINYAEIKLGRPSIANTNGGYWQMAYNVPGAINTTNWIKPISGPSSTNPILPLDMNGIQYTDYANGDTVTVVLRWVPTYIPEIDYNVTPDQYFTDVNGNRVTSAPIGSEVTLHMTVRNDDSRVDDLKIRDNFQDNGVTGSGAHDGTPQNPYSVWETVQRANTTTGAIGDATGYCHPLGLDEFGVIAATHPADMSKCSQYPGSYVSPKTNNQLVWRRGSVVSGVPAVGSTYEVTVTLRVKSDTSLVGKYLSTKIAGVPVDGGVEKDRTLATGPATLMITASQLRLNYGIITGGTRLATDPAPAIILNGNSYNTGGSLVATDGSYYTLGNSVGDPARLTFNGYSVCNSATRSADTCLPFIPSPLGGVAVNTNSTWVYAHFTYIAVPPPTLSLVCSPQTGLSPLVVRVEATVLPAGNYSFNYSMGDGTTLENRQSPIYYTYSGAGSYTISAFSPQLGQAISDTCAPVTVSDPTTGGGGEVTP